MNEKITDQARGMFEKATGYVVVELIDPPFHELPLLLPILGFHANLLTGPSQGLLECNRLIGFGG